MMHDCMLKIDRFLGNQILRILSLKVVKNKQIRCEICLFYSFAAVAAFFLVQSIFSNSQRYNNKNSAPT